MSRPHSPPKSLCFSLFLNHSFSSFLILFFYTYSCSGLVLVSVSALFATSLLNGFLFGVCWFTFFLNDFFGEFCYLLSLSQEEGKKSCFIYGRSFSAATCLFFGRELFHLWTARPWKKKKETFFSSLVRLTGALLRPLVRFNLDFLTDNEKTQEMESRSCFWSNLNYKSFPLKPKKECNCFN